MVKNILIPHEIDFYYNLILKGLLHSFEGRLCQRQTRPLLGKNWHIYRRAIPIRLYQDLRKLNLAHDPIGGHVIEVIL